MRLSAFLAGTQAVLGWRPGRLARQSSGLFGWMVLRAGAQAATVFVLARTLGGTGYGQFVAILAVASFLTPFVGLGLSNIVLRNGAKDPEHLDGYVRFALRWWAFSLLPAVALSQAIAAWLPPADLPRVASSVAVAAELVVLSLVELSARRQQALHRPYRFGAINAGLPAVRLLAISVVLLALEPNDVEFILWTYSLISFAYAAALLRFLPWRPRESHRRGQQPMAIGSGLSLSLSAFAMRLQGEFNKPMLAHLSYELVGSYNVAQRVTDLLSLPVLALQEALWPRLYAQKDPSAAMRQGRVLLLCVAMLCAGFTWFAAPLLPLIMGPDFRAAADVGRMLAGIPLMQALRSIVNFKVIDDGRMRLIGWACTAGATVNIVLLAWLVPTHSATGAVIAAYASEFFMTLWLLLGLRSKLTLSH